MKLANPKKILIIQLRRIGDVIFTLPVARQLKQAFPAARVDFLVEKPADAIAARNRFVDQVLVYDPKRAAHWIARVRAERYDAIFDFLSTGRTLWLTALSGAKLRAGFAGAWNRALAYNVRPACPPDRYIVDQKMELLRAAGAPVKSWSWDLEPPDADRAWAREYLATQGLGSRPLVAIAPASRRATRNWIPERFTEVARALSARPFDVLFFWGPGEEEWVRGLAENAAAPGGGRVLIAPDTTLWQMAALMERCSAVFGVDNGPRNMAVALNVPSVAIFGPTNPVTINPHDDPRHAAVRDEKLHCIGCGSNTCAYQHECMANVSAAAVLERLQGAMRANEENAWTKK